IVSVTQNVYSGAFGVGGDREERTVRHLQRGPCPKGRASFYPQVTWSREPPSAKRSSVASEPCWSPSPVSKAIRPLARAWLSAFSRAARVSGRLAARDSIEPALPTRRARF